MWKYSSSEAMKYMQITNIWWGFLNLLNQRSFNENRQLLNNQCQQGDQQIFAYIINRSLKWYNIFL